VLATIRLGRIRLGRIRLGRHRLDIVVKAHKRARGIHVLGVKLSAKNRGASNGHVGYTS
jgi:hypothetical protein